MNGYQAGAVSSVASKVTQRRVCARAWGVSSVIGASVRFGGTAGPAWWRGPRQVTVTRPSCPRQRGSARSSAEHGPLDRGELWLAGHDRARLLERRLRVLQPV